jgi:hypothetical protein
MRFSWNSFRLLTFNGDLVLAGAGVLKQIDLDGDFANAALVWGVCEREENGLNGLEAFGTTRMNTEKKRQDTTIVHMQSDLTSKRFRRGVEKPEESGCRAERLIVFLFKKCYFCSEILF